MSTMPPIYQFTLPLLSGREMHFQDLQNKVILIVNTASKCGFTPQYKSLEELYERYKDRGLMVLGFPCNQFGNQEPGDAKEIAGECLVNYGVSFPIFAKIDVNGPAATPLFQYLKKELPGLLLKRIHWNFTKFLVGPDGTPYKRYAPTTDPLKLIPDIEKLLARRK